MTFFELQLKYISKQFYPYKLFCRIQNCKHFYLKIFLIRLTSLVKIFSFHFVYQNINFSKANHIICFIENALTNNLYLKAFSLQRTVSERYKLSTLVSVVKMNILIELVTKYPTKQLYPLCLQKLGVKHFLFKYIFNSAYHFLNVRH